MIDYGVVSKCLVPYIETFEVDAVVPWGPHDGIRLRLKRDPRAVMVRTLQRPRALADAARSPCLGPPQEISWPEAVGIARQRVAEGTSSRGMEMQRDAASAMGVLEPSKRLGVELAVWAHATELQALARAGVVDYEQARPFLGRAAAPRFQRRPLLGRPRFVAESLAVRGGYGAAARLWATCGALTSKMRSAINRNVGQEELGRFKEHIIGLSLRDTGDLRSAWAAMPDGADVSAGLFAIMAACSPDASASSVDVAIRTFERLERVEAERGREKSNNAWHNWVATALVKGAKQAHRWTNQPNSGAPDVAAPESNLPADIAQHHTDKWAEVWRSGHKDKVRLAFEAVCQLRERALRHPSHGSTITDVVPAKVREISRQFRKGTSIGSDFIGFQDVQESSEESLQELCRIMQECIRNLVLPIQALLVLGSLLGKKLGGTRCIAICATFYRLLMAVMKCQVREWDMHVGLQGDSALPGRSPHAETAWRHLTMEQAVLRGKAVGQLLWDVKQFFDSLDVPLVIERSERLHFPVDQLALGMQAHRAPRILRAAGSFGSCIKATGRSLLAGCTLSTSLSRGFLCRPLQRCCEASRRHKGKASHGVNQHVDDVNQVVIADTEEEVATRCLIEGLRVANVFTRSGLVISDKSVALASSRKLASTIAGMLTRAGQPICSAAAADDLGVSTSCGARRAVGAFKKRLAKGTRRSKRVRALNSANPKAAKLYGTGVKPQQGYGAAICGAAPSQVRIMRRSAVQCVASAGTQPCTTTILAWRLNPRQDPAVACPLEQVRLWMQLWARAHRAERVELREAWARALPRILLGGLQWHRVTGPMQATIAVLGQVGWHPVAPTNGLRLVAKSMRSWNGRLLPTPPS